MSHTIQVLEVKIQSIHNESNISTNTSFKCDYCDYKASKNSVLKQHVTSKHKPKIPAPENERNKDHDKSMQLFMSPKERAPEKGGGRRGQPKPPFQERLANGRRPLGKNASNCAHTQRHTADRHCNLETESAQ